MGEPLRLVERRMPAPARGQVVVRNLATSMNFHDVLNLKGVLANLAWPRVPFSDNCGEIVAVGADAGNWKIGERVIANFFPDWLDGDPQPRYCDIVFGDQIDGFLQDHTVVDTRSLVRAPANLSAVEAATLPCAGLTAWRAIAVEARIQPGQVVVIQGTGGVALFALQFAKLFGAEVILISSSDEKLEFGRRLGADHTHNYRQDQAWDRKVLEITSGRGADLVVEVGGAETLTRSINAAKINGHVSVIGVRSGFGMTAPIAVEPVLIRNLTLRGITVGNVRQLEAMCQAIELHRIRPVIDRRRFAFRDVASAAALMEQQAHIGKIAIDIAGSA
jgi:NADPH:quinone reductase-like Zn-dependent oxidoreductase